MAVSLKIKKPFWQPELIFGGREKMKKFFAVAMATVMTLAMSVSAFAADTISGGWWTAWTPGYEVKDTVEFDIEVKGGAENWNNISAVFVNVATDGKTAPSADNFEGYKEYAVVRADSWGWGGGDNLSCDGKAIEYTSTLEDANASGDAWDEFKAVMADAHIDATVTKTATGFELKYDVKGANGTSYTYTAKTEADTSAGLYVFFVCDTSEVTVAKVEAPAQTGDFTAVLPVALVAVAAMAVVVVMKKRTVAE